ncbi:MAG: glycerol acyltransferase, partial [Bacteroidales bacterium]
QMGYTIIGTGVQNLDPQRRLLIAANHPFGGIDGMALICEVGKIRKDILFPVNDILLGLPNLKPLFVPINKYGTNTENYDVLQTAFQSENILLYFPAGLCSRKKHKKICDLEWKKTFISKARESQRDIIPVFVQGQNSPLFYNLANWRKKLHIKLNIEQFLLINEMFIQKNKTIHFIIGEAIPYQTFDERCSDKEWAEKVKQHVYDLASNPNKKFETHI